MSSSGNWVNFLPAKIENIKATATSSGVSADCGRIRKKCPPTKTGTRRVNTNASALAKQNASLKKRPVIATKVQPEANNRIGWV
mmetsp:Transcript_38664/g.64232  ORF Transcript_38664/g.64232 Transcript_38664/m.64232 type:complete len:84 (-) Transcript_38664:646-897(-)